jgi:CDP-diacylglycerol--glycerol-3-phosphate 3-phosphatidyltransferase
MTDASPNPATNKVWNVPNQVTMARLVLSIALFAIMSFHWYLTSLVVFIVAASTDWIDGYWARKYGQVTQLGRILDPFADKIIICGSFIYLAAAPESMIVAWMAVVVVGRELLVTALRSFIEERGGDFSANMAGKLKMVLQCFAVGFSMFRLTYLDAATGEFPTDRHPPEWLDWSLLVLVWAAVISTVYSGVGYVVGARRAILS